MTEPLIEKILVERYPELQREQVSCHATHLEGRPRPALRPLREVPPHRRACSPPSARTPAAAATRDAQIAACLAALPRAALAQEAADVRLLRRLAADPRDAAARRGLLALRWDPVRAPRDLLPQPLRVPLLRLVAQHAYARRQTIRTPSRPTA